MKTRSYYAIGTVLLLLALAFHFARQRSERWAGNASSVAGKKAASRTPRGIQWSGEGEEKGSRRDGDAFEIRGRVVDALDGTAIEGASVSLREGDGEIVLATESETDGSFSFPATKSARVVAAAADGYAFLTETIDASDDGETVLALDPAVQVSGKVVDARGQPVAGAEVWIEDEEGDSWERWPRPASDVATSGADGTFVVEDAPSGKLIARAKHSRYAPGESEIGGVGPGRSRDAITIKLLDAGVVSGRVLRDGVPVEGASVELDMEELHTATSGPGGAYRIAGLSPGKAWVLARTETGRGVGFAEIVEGGEANDVDILLAAAGTISGHVLDEDGKPIAGASVHANRGRVAGEDRALLSSVAVKTGDDGAFTLGGIPEGMAMSISAVHDRYRSARVEGKVGVELEITLQSGAAISGTVQTSDGRPFPIRARVTATLRGNRYFSLSEEALPKKGGAFRFEGLEPGDWEVTAEARGFSPSPVVKVALGETSSGPLKLVIGAKGSVRGRLVSRDGGPIAGARVSISHPLRTRLPGEESVRLDWSDSVRSDSKGRFVLESGAGDSQLFIYHPEFAAEVVRTTIPPEGDIDLGTIELRPGAGASAIFEFSGIGAVLVTDEQGVGIRSVLPESPASRAGVRAGDRVLAVDGTPVAGMELDELVMRVRGPVGTTVSLSLGRDGNAEPLRIDVVREKLRA